MRLFLITLLCSASLLASEQLDKEYQEALVKAKAEYEAKVKLLNEDYIKKLKDQLVVLTKAGDLDAALAVREKMKLVNLDHQINKLKEEIISLKVEEPIKIEGPIKKITPGPRVPVTVFGNADDAFDLTINGQRIVSGGGSADNHTAKATKKDTTIAIGDVILVRVNNVAYSKGFCCIIKCKGQDLSISSNLGWKTYIPKNKTTWSDIRGITEVGDVVLGTNARFKDETIKESGATASDCDVIWGKDDESYLLHQVTKDSFKK